MELHERFIKIAGLESSIVETIESALVAQDTIDFIMIKSIEDCYSKLKANLTKENLELLRLLFCQLYKLNYKRGMSSETKFTAKFHEFVELFTNDMSCTGKEIQVILYDIMILHLILFEDQKNFINLFENFKNSTDKLLTDSYLKVLKCFLESWEMLYFLNFKENLNPLNKTHLESCKKVLISSILYDLQNCVPHKETVEWDSLYYILSKVINIARSTKILSTFIQEIPLHDSALTIFATLCDLILPVDSSNIDIDYEFVLNPDLWFLIQNSLIHAQSPERKQALYLFKRTVNFIELNKNEVKKAKLFTSSKNKINPFICDSAESVKILSIKDLIISFILIMEALEEKQKHLVIPSLSLLNDLEKGWLEHKCCGNCFDLRWLFCIYAKILKHDNNSVVKWGLLRLLNFDLTTEEKDDFIILIVQSLCNTFLYEKKVDNKDPEISIALHQWFINYPDSIKTFINKISEIQWGSVPIFYTLKSLFSASNELEKISKWEKEQLSSLRSLMEKSIKLHPHMLRSMSQIMLIKLITRFHEIRDLTYISHLLSEFSIKDMQEPNCWFDLIKWFKDISNKTAVDFIHKIFQELKLNDTNDRISMSTLSLIIQLLYEGKVICQTKDCCSNRELKNLFFSLDNVDSRPYVDINHIIKIIDLIYNLLNLRKSIPEFILQYFINYEDVIYRFVIKLLNNQNLTYEQSQVCVKALKNITYHSEGKINTIVMIKDCNKKDLEEKCIQVVENANKHNEVQLLLAIQLWTDNIDLFHYDNQFFRKIITELLQIPKSNNRNVELSGTIGSQYYVALSKFVKNHVLTSSVEELRKNDELLDILSSILDASGNQVLLYFSDVMNSYSTVVQNDGKLENFKFLIKSFWNCNFGSKRDNTFWMVNQRLTRCINGPNFLDCEPLQKISMEFTARMLNEGDALPGLKYILLTCSEIKGHFRNFIDLLLNGLLHGKVLRRDQRIGMQTCAVGKNLINRYELKGEQFEAQDFLNRQCNVDPAVRAVAVLKICQVIRENDKNASILLSLVLEQLIPLKKKRYYADSQLHRLKHRIFQILLILQPKLNEDSTKVLYKTLCDLLIEDTDQHSVRLMKEWLLVRIYLSNNNLLEDLWIFFDKVYNERPSSTSSVIGIIWHIAKRLDKKKLSEFIKTALSKLGTCGMGQQFGMRYFGQVFFVKLYELLGEGCDIRIEYSSFYKVILESLNNRNFKKNPIKIDEDFFYTVFNPLDHYSLETIYHQLPRLSNVSFEEWVTKDNFKEQMLLDALEIDFNFFNSDKSLDEARIPYAILKTNEHSKLEEVECTDNMKDMQKKITIWKTMLPNNEELQEVQNLANMKYRKQKMQNIIVIASFIDKSQNLGGIARTCEIFGVEELVINSFKRTEEKDFQALSVSADKWLKITEVNSLILDKYLLELKNSGWTLIGAEQTANSVNLFDFKFPEKTALVLGNEKSGIPANTISLLDLCVEVPQFGIIRSLNVHVTSAICIWEYVRQHQLEK